jgi:chemotaxis protein methyltransferase CheR
MQDNTIAGVKEMIRQATGIVINEENTADLSRVLVNRLLTLKLEEDAYPAYFVSHHEEIVTVASQFTIQETSFYRYKQHYDRLKFQVLPDLIRRKQATANPRLRILSAGCATGEEPYTIAMIVHDLIKDSEDWDVRIVATDINADALQRAREAVYSDYRLRNIDKWYVYRYFEPRGESGPTGTYRLKGFIKSMVDFRQCNLIREPFELADLAGVDIVLCENVIIYFCLESIQRLIDNFHAILAPDGFLFLGHSETLNIVQHRFELTWWNDSFAYRKSGVDTGETAPADDRPLPLPEYRPAPLPAQSPRWNEGHALTFPEFLALFLQSVEAGDNRRAGELICAIEKSDAPLSDLFHIVKAEYLFEQKHYIPAADACRKAAGLNPQSAEAHLLLGAIYLDLGMGENAQFEIKTALYLDQTSVLAYYYLGEYYRLCGNATERDYCLTYARHLLEEQGNMLTGQGFPHYRERRNLVFNTIKTAGQKPGTTGLPAGDGRSQGEPPWVEKNK